MLETMQIKVAGRNMENNDKKIKMYGFYSGYNKLVASIPSRSIERAKKIFEEMHPDKKYSYIKVMY